MSSTTTKNRNKKRLLKIVASDDHDLDRIKRILKRINPDNFILESKSRMYNMRTLHLAYHLRKEGCRDISMKFYKGEVLKILFSRIREPQVCVPANQTPETVPADPNIGGGVY